MGYNGSNRGRSNRGYRGLSKSSNRYASSLFFGRKGIVTTVAKSMINSSTMSTKRSKNRCDYYDLGSAIQNNSAFENSQQSYSNDSSDNDELYVLVFFAAITVILLSLAFTDVWWFGFCYFFGCISFWIILLCIILYSSSSSNHEPKPRTLTICGLALVAFGILPFNIYSDYAIINLDVNHYIPNLVEFEAFIGTLGGLALIVFVVYNYIQKLNK